MSKKLAIYAVFSVLLTMPFQGQSFQGRATYISKSKMQLGSWGARLSEARKKQIEARLKNRLEKIYFLTFNTLESFFKEDEKIDAISGATDSWGAYFSRGPQYKNIKERTLVQSQEFYGKRFLVKDNLYDIDWVMSSESKKIGNYTCYKAKASVPYIELKWYTFSWSDLRKTPTIAAQNSDDNTISVEAWYAPQIPVLHGPGEFWGLPGLILEVSFDNTTLLCTEVIINKEKSKTEEINIPSKGQEITKTIYAETIRKRMQDFRNNRGGRRTNR